MHFYKNSKNIKSILLKLLLSVLLFYKISSFYSHSSSSDDLEYLAPHYVPPYQLFFEEMKNSRIEKDWDSFNYLSDKIWNDFLQDIYEEFKKLDVKDVVGKRNFLKQLKYKVDWLLKEKNVSILDPSLEMNLKALSAFLFKKYLGEATLNSVLKGEVDISIINTGFQMSRLNTEVSHPFGDFVRNSQQQFLNDIFAGSENVDIILDNNKLHILGLDSFWTNMNNKNLSLTDKLNKQRPRNVLEVLYTEGLNSQLLSSYKNEIKKQLGEDIYAFIESRYGENLLKRIDNDVSGADLTDNEKKKYKIWKQQYINPEDKSFSTEKINCISFTQKIGDQVSSLKSTLDKKNGSKYFEKIINNEFNILGNRIHEIEKQMLKEFSSEKTNIFKDLEKIQDLPMVKQILDALEDKYPWFGEQVFEFKLDLEGRDLSNQIDNLRHFLKFFLDNSDVDTILSPELKKKMMQLMQLISDREELWEKQNYLKPWFVDKKVGATGVNLKELFKKQEYGEKLKFYVSQFATDFTIENIYKMYDEFERILDDKEWPYEGKGMGWVPLKKFGSNELPKNSNTIGKLIFDCADSEFTFKNFKEQLNKGLKVACRVDRNNHFIKKEFFDYTVVAAMLGIDHEFLSPERIKVDVRDIDGNLKEISIVNTIDGDEHRQVFFNDTLSGSIDFFNVSFDFDSFRSSDGSAREQGILPDDDGIFYSIHDDIPGSSIKALLELTSGKNMTEAELNTTLADSQFFGKSVQDIIKNVPDNVKVDLNPLKRKDARYLNDMQAFLKKLNVFLKEKNFAPERIENINNMIIGLESIIKDIEENGSTNKTFSGNIKLNEFMFLVLLKTTRGRVRTDVYDPVSISAAYSTDSVNLIDAFGDLRKLIKKKNIDEKDLSKFLKEKLRKNPDFFAELMERIRRHRDDNDDQIDKVKRFVANGIALQYSEIVEQYCEQLENKENIIISKIEKELKQFVSSDIKDASDEDISYMAELYYKFFTHKITDSQLLNNIIFRKTGIKLSENMIPFLKTFKEIELLSTSYSIKSDGRPSEVHEELLIAA